MKRIVKLFLLFPALLGCNSLDEVYQGDKIILPYHEGGEIVICTVEDAYGKVLTNKQDCAFFVFDASLIPCMELRTEIALWTQRNNALIYEIDYTVINESNSELLIEMTVGYYQWNEETSIPCVYFFKEGQTKMRSDATNTTTYLNRYIEVNKPEN